MAYPETPQQGRQQFDLAGYRDLQPLTAALRGLLSGDLALLQRFYTLTLSGNMDAWQLQLLPRDPAAAALIEQITANGHRNRIEKLLTVERNGDRSLMTISPH
ncbi:MAG: LolA-related protein [Gammaproteobacteria bacterium]